MTHFKRSRHIWDKGDFIAEQTSEAENKMICVQEARVWRLFHCFAMFTLYRHGQNICNILMDAAGMKLAASFF